MSTIEAQRAAEDSTGPSLRLAHSDAPRRLSDADTRAPARPVEVLLAGSSRMAVDEVRVALEHLTAGVHVAVPCEELDCLVDRIISDQPDVTVIHAAGATTTRLVRRLRAAFPTLGIAVFIDDDLADAPAVLAAGADAVIDDTAGITTLALAVLTAADGATTLSPGVRRAIIGDVADAHVVDRLRDDDATVWDLVATGCTDHEIADELHVSLRTAKRRVARLLARLGVDNRVQAAELGGRLSHVRQAIAEH